MCGILGIIDNRGVSLDSFGQMRDTMIHRGPDDAGTWVSRDRKVALGHRRLSIIDLSVAGRQPMSDSGGRIWITYNGEIYNFQAIRKELEGKGYNFKSQTDTEVIVNAYKEWGAGCLSKLNGMFAFGIYDGTNNTLFLARDRLGKKPLYYWADTGRGKFAFSSEIKAFCRDRDFSRDIDLQALNFYLTFGYIPGDLCIFRAVKKLPPAHAMIYYPDTGQKKLWSYWDVPLFAENFMSVDELMEGLELLLEDAVRLRMISDVPLGAFLSGGIDSSLVVAMMSRVSDRPVKTFSIGFEDSAYNELPYARIVAGHFGTEHHELIVKPDMFSILPELARQFDEPFADSSMLPTYYVSKVTRESVTVALSGDGGDEVFGGYRHYLAAVIEQYTAMFIPLALRRGIARAAGCLSEKSITKRRLAKFRLDPYDAFVERCSEAHFNSQFRKNLLNEDITRHLNNKFAEPEISIREYLMKRADDIVNRLTYTDMKTYLPDDIMVKVDRTSMLVSLEARAPFLDFRIAEYAFKNIPGDLKIKGITTKFLLKKLAKKTLPRELDIRRKRGFAVPLSAWFRGKLAPHIKEILFGHKNCFFNQDYIRQLLNEHEAGIDHGARLFALLIFYLWGREYLRDG